jgi:SAM-dependent methyltransferase
MDSKELIKHLKKAKSLQEAAFLILGIKTEGKRYYFTNISERFRKQYAYTYNLYFKNRLSSYDDILRIFFEETSFVKKPGNILDFGCGSALLLIAIASKIYKQNRFRSVVLYGADNSPVMIKLGRKNIQERGLLKKIKLFKIKKSPKELKLPKLKYIISTSTFHLLKDPIKTIEEMIKILPKNGEIFIQDIQRDSPWKLKQKRLIHLATTLSEKDFIEGFKGHLSALAKKDIKKALDIIKRQYKISYKIYSIKRKNYYDLTFGAVIKKHATR